MIFALRILTGESFYSQILGEGETLAKLLTRTVVFDHLILIDKIIKYETLGNRQTPKSVKNEFTLLSAISA